MNRSNLKAIWIYARGEKKKILAISVMSIVVSHQAISREIAGKIIEL